MQLSVFDRRSLALYGVVLCTAVVVLGMAAPLPDADVDSADTIGGPVAPAADTVIAVVAGDTITSSEFERVYRRHVTETVTDTVPEPSANAASVTAPMGGSEPRSASASESAESREAFLRRYVDFRLKVKAARDQGLDTTSTLRDDVNRYRTQVARPRLMEDRVIDPLIRELYDRRATEVDVSHILIRVDENADPADTLEAHRAIQSIVDTLEAGAPFADVARSQSDDPSAQRDSGPGAGGRLGYMTAGRLVKPFEDRMYATPVGERSGIVRTQFGYHVLYVHDRRPRPTPVRIAHIVIRPASASAADSADARALADSLQAVAASGAAAFDSLARAYSDDTRSAARGGEIGVLSPDRNVPPAFRKAAFGLESPGDVSGVIETRFGLHILQLLERIPRPPYEEAYESLKQQASRLPRFQSQDDRLARYVLEKRGGGVDTAAISEALYGVPNALDSLAQPLTAAQESIENANMTVIAIGDSTFTLRDMAQSVAPGSIRPRTKLGEALASFLTAKALELEAAHLEQQDEAFRRNIQEYREGLLLFEFMQTYVWDPAARDSTGLRTMYDNHAERYQYPERVQALRFSAAQDTLLPTFSRRASDVSTAGDRSRAPASTDRVSANQLSDAVASASQSPVVRVDTTYILPDASTPQRQLFERANRAFVGPVASGAEQVVFVRLGLEAPRRMTFQEARSRVLGDYQEAYEETVLDRLRSRYSVQTYPERLSATSSSTGSTTGAGASSSTPSPGS